MSGLHSLRRAFIALGALALLALTGCASMNTLSSDVSTYGPWPAARKPASFVFERLPSQQEHPEHQQLLENAARGAIEAAGFRAAADPAGAEYLMQVGARITADDPWIYNQPLFWRPGPWPYVAGPGRWGGGPGPFWANGPGPWGPWGYSNPPSYDREVALLIRDRKTGQLLYEARAHNAGLSPDIERLLPAMFAAALKDFPGVGPNPRAVTTQISSGR